MKPTSLCTSRFPCRSRSAKVQRVHQKAFAPQAEDHFPRVSDATDVLLSRPLPSCFPLSDPDPLQQIETSHYSGIADACITFVVAPWHFQLTLNASPSRQVRER